MGRQVTYDELYNELVEACDGNRRAAFEALQVIDKHLANGDRIKRGYTSMYGAMTIDFDDDETLADLDTLGYRVGDPDPTPETPPYCGARYGHPTGGPWCGWRPNHDGPHVAGDGQTVLVEFPWGDEAGFHQDAGKTLEELKSDAPPETPEPGPSSGTVLWRMAEAVRERVDNAPAVSEQELAEQVRMMSQLLLAVAERVEQ